MGCHMETTIHSKNKYILLYKTYFVYLNFFFQSHNSNFKNVENKIYELIKFRSKILSGTLPVDELKEVQRLATSTIDVGNK